MAAFIELLRSVGVFTAGIVARLGLFLVMVAVLVIPALVGAAVLRALAARRQKRLGVVDLEGVPFRPDLAYAPGHLWLHARAGGAVEIGLDAIAQRLMPAVTAVEVPPPGTRVARGEPLATLHGGGRALPIPSPVSGTVAGVNAAVVRDPSLVKREGYGRGWLVVVRPEGEAAPVAEGEAAARWMRDEARRFGRLVEERLGFAAADGGALVAPAPWLLGEEGWRTLVDAFLRPEPNAR